MMFIQKFIDEFFIHTKDSPLAPFHDNLQQQLHSFFYQHPHGSSDEWHQALIRLPKVTASYLNLASGCISIGSNQQLPQPITDTLRTFMPWRKGPFNLFGTLIDAEWHSDWKWQRLARHISSLTARNVLDIGCGNGYYLLRILGAGAKLAVGIDPTQLFLYQFCLLRHFIPGLPAYMLPLRSEHLPAFGWFDTVFSLGVLYHRRSPIDHLTELFSFLKPGGELVLETLVVEGNVGTVLAPKNRYAKMTNIWFLPSVSRLELWLQRLGFVRINVVDINQTSIEEQRATRWMKFQSLRDFLNPHDNNLTIEGYPAPRRAILVANKPI